MENKVAGGENLEKRSKFNLCSHAYASPATYSLIEQSRSKNISLYIQVRLEPIMPE